MSRNSTHNPNKQSLHYLIQLLIGCDIEGPQFNCFLPAHHCFHTPGGPLKYSLEEHPFAVFGMALAGNGKTLASCSNQLIVWDVQTGDLTRALNPNIEGIFLGMAMSADDKHVVAYSNNNQVVAMSLITGDHVTIEPEGMEEQMEVERIGFTYLSDAGEAQRILLWSQRQFYLYELDGRLVHQEKLDKIAPKGKVGGMRSGFQIRDFKKSTYLRF